MSEKRVAGFAMGCICYISSREKIATNVSIMIVTSSKLLYRQENRLLLISELGFFLIHGIVFLYILTLNEIPCPIFPYCFNSL